MHTKKTARSLGKRTSFQKGILAITLLALTLPLALPASASAAEPRIGRVGVITFVGKALNDTNASITMTWPKVSAAEKYEVFTSTNYDKTKPDTTPNASVTTNKATISGLKPGKDYFFTVRAVKTNKDGKINYGQPGGRVGHSTISAQAKVNAKASRFSLMTWNICSNACSNINGRAKIIGKRIQELKPAVVTLQESSRYSKAPTGYLWGHKGQNGILYKSSEFSKVKATKGKPTSGTNRFASKSATSGKGISWTALKHKSGEYVVAFDAHLVVGNSKKAVAQREYEASRVNTYMNSVLGKLAKSHGKITDWKKARVIVAGDFNTHKSRAGEKALRNLEKTGLYDSIDEAQKMTLQHHNSANPQWSTKPVLGLTWGDHVDKIFVKSSKAIVHDWRNAGKISKGKWVKPLGSDHHPVMVDVSLVK